MGWLFACFGYTKKRKRPKKASKFGPKSRRIRSYQPLESDVPEEDLDASPQPLTSCSNLDPRDDKPKDENKARIRKKVRFNLEVTIYELLPAEPDDATTNSFEFGGHKNWEEVEEDENEHSMTTTKVFLGYAPLKKPSYSSNHRYSNCCEDEDEDHDDDDNEIEDELSDLNDDDDDDGEDEYGSCFIEADKVYHEEIPEEHHHIISVPLSSSEDGELGTGNGSKLTTRFRSHYVIPVLNPIENLSQWKAVKAKKF